MITVIDALERARLAWCVFGGFAGPLYGWRRRSRDVDVLVAAPRDAVRRAVGAGIAAGENGWIAGVVEIWSAPLRLRAADATHLLHADRDLLARRRRFGALSALCAEDQLVLKAILRRGPADGKDDVGDARAIVHRGGLDWPYVWERARRSSAADRLRETLAEIGA